MQRIYAGIEKLFNLRYRYLSLHAIFVKKINCKDGRIGKKNERIDTL